MRKLGIFMNVTLNGLYADANSDMSWAHQSPDDAEWNEFTAGNASGDGALLFGRVTYDMMANFWPTPMAQQMMPTVAEGMNKMPKYVVSRTLDKASWNNTTVIKGDLAVEIRKLKATPGPDLVTLGSGSIVAQLADANLLDSAQAVIHPIALGAGKALFGGIARKLQLKLTKSRTFKNGNVVLWYDPA